MAYDKAVDSAQLDADLTLVADAIRTKGGTDAQLAFPSGFVSAVQAFETGGGNTGIIARDVIIASESMTIYEILNAVEVKAVYKNSLFLMGCYDDVVPDKGIYTICNYFIWHSGQTIVVTNQTYQNGMKSFASFKTLGFNEASQGFMISADGRLTRERQGSTSCCVAAGGAFKLIEVPIDRETYMPDLTLWSDA